jgi:hypothetical protein
MIKIVINNCHGGFGLSDEAHNRFRENKGITDPYHFAGDIPRDDPDLIRIVEEMGEEANGECAKLKIVEIPDDVNWYVEEYDGCEWVAERHRTWH